VNEQQIRCMGALHSRILMRELNLSGSLFLFKDYLGPTAHAVTTKQFTVSRQYHVKMISIEGDEMVRLCE
jgi:hypothetical protein